MEIDSISLKFKYSINYLQLNKKEFDIIIYDKS